MFVVRRAELVDFLVEARSTPRHKTCIRSAARIIPVLQILEREKRNTIIPGSRRVTRPKGGKDNTWPDLIEVSFHDSSS